MGLVHAAADTISLTLYAGSLAARLNRPQGVGRALAYLGLGAANGIPGGARAYKQRRRRARSPNCAG